MSFALNGTQISGGTFNNVSGNMTQVINSHSAHLAAPAGQRSREGAQELPGSSELYNRNILEMDDLGAPGTTDGVIGPHRGARLGRHSHRPYGAREPVSLGKELRHSQISPTVASYMEFRTKDYLEWTTMRVRRAAPPQRACNWTIIKLCPTKRHTLYPGAQRRALWKAS